jgi:LacI family transcriptional regulator
MAVIGFDDIPSAQYMNPSLSTVHVPIYELGTRAVELVIRQMNGALEDEKKDGVLATKLMPRASCGCGPAQ